MTSQITTNLLTNRKLVCIGLCLISAASLAAAYTAEYLYGLRPCILCLYQRAPYALIMILSLTGLLFSCKNNKITANIVIFCALLFACGSVIAFYHTGVELKWWKSFLEKCNASFDFNSPDSYLKTLQETKAVRCDEIPWSDPVIGLSMANYNAILSFIYACLTLTAGILMRKKNYV
tara:strand:+ start:48 stop:578 length:531 start_codon:yes stop_codon:yes gene_type:complete